MRSVQDLQPAELENLSFDMIGRLGFTNLVWRTPGADGGRDIEGTYIADDVSGGSEVQRWYIECKRYETSLDWPTVWKKIAYADSHEASYLLIITNSNPSPNCETEISRWNGGRHPTKVRIWRGYDIERLLLQIPSVALKYGLYARPDKQTQGFVEIALQINKIIQAVYVAEQFGEPYRSGLEAAAALSELFSMRMDDLNRYGRMVKPDLEIEAFHYDWLQVNGQNLQISAVPFRAIATVFRYLNAANKIEVEISDEFVTLVAKEPRIVLTQQSNAFLSEVSLWCDIEIIKLSEDVGSMTIKDRRK